MRIRLPYTRRAAGVVTLAAALAAGGCASPGKTVEEVPADAVTMSQADAARIGEAETLVVHPSERQRRLARQPVGPMHIVTRQELERTGQADIAEALRRTLTIVD